MVPLFSLKEMFADKPFYYPLQAFFSLFVSRLTLMVNRKGTLITISFLLFFFLLPLFRTLLRIFPLLFRRFYLFSPLSNHAFQLGVCDCLAPPLSVFFLPDLPAASSAGPVRFMLRCASLFYDKI